MIHVPETLTHNYVHLDMDGVLVDCMGAIMRLFGVETIDGQPAAHAIPGWDETGPTLTRHLGREVTETEVWDRVRSCGAAFWKDLHPYPWAADVVQAAEALGSLLIVTSPCEDGDGHTMAGCCDGKIEWIRRHFPRLGRSVILAPRKGRLAHPGALLIDDGPHNLTAYEAAGACTFKWPAPWNTPNYTVADAWSALARLRNLR